ncbi:MAG: benzoate-CoA ligase family protein [Burkholderiales bacterium]
MNIPSNSAPFNFASWLIEQNAGRLAKTAYIDDQGTLSYGELFERVRSMGAAMMALGIRRDERVLLCMHDCTDWPVVFLGALYVGIVPVAVNTLLPAEDYAYMLEHSRAQAVFTSDALVTTLQQAIAQSANEVHHRIVSGAADARDSWTSIATLLAAQAVGGAPTGPLAPARVGGDDPGFWLYSSGSTGRPKGAVHSHANLYWTCELYGKNVLALREDDVCFSAAKLFFAYGLGNALSFPLAAGATVVLLAGRPTPEAVFSIWQTHRPTVFFGAPTGYAGMLAHPQLPAREHVALRMCSSAGEALPQDIGERFRAHFGCHIIDGIGSTEMLHVFLSNRPDDVRYGTTGKPVDGYEIELRDDTGGAVADGEVGDLYIKGASAALMYWGNRDKSRSTFQGAWTMSGDKYVRDAQGYYTYSGRSDDMLKVSGQYVSPFEVEATLVQHASVLEAAVIGVTDAQGLTRAKAFVVLRDGTHATPELADALKAFVKQRLAPHKYPRELDFLAELPKTATGKIQRFRLRAQQAVRP